MDPDQNSCVLSEDSISILVQESLLDSENSSRLPSDLPDCELSVGAVIRIPYDPDDIAELSQALNEDEPVNDEETIEAEEAAAENQPPIQVDADPGKETEQEPTPDPLPVEAEVPEEVTAYEEQPSDPSGGLIGEFNSLAQTTGQDSMLTIVLAVLAVVGGGAAWKFYRQHSEQKHEQKMAQMKLDAKSKGMEGEPPGPCQSVHAQLKAEVEELKARLDKADKKLALNADFDGDELERKVRKLEKWRKALEEDDE